MNASATTLTFPLEPALDFLQSLWALNQAIERTSKQMEHDLGVTAQQRLLIRCLGKYPGITGSQLAELLHLDRGTISTSLNRLERQGLISKRRDPRDSRRVPLGLTPQGKRLDTPAPVTVERAVEQLFTQLGPEQLAVMKGSLQQLTANLNAALPAREPKPLLTAP